MTSRMVIEMTEIWKTIPRWPSYEASDMGRIKRIDSGLVLKPIPHKRYKYFRVGMYNQGVMTMVEVHRLVLLSFKGNPPSPKHKGAHWDGNKQNNLLGNLRWATHQENMDDNARLGISTAAINQVRGEKVNTAVMTEPKVIELRERAKKEQLPALALEYGIGYATAWNIIKRNSWSHI